MFSDIIYNFIVFMISHYKISSFFIFIWSSKLEFVEFSCFVFNNCIIKLWSKSFIRFNCLDSFNKLYVFLSFIFKFWSFYSVLFRQELWHWFRLLNQEILLSIEHIKSLIINLISLLIRENYFVLFNFCKLFQLQ